jgi:hypothetical protein
MLPTHRRSVVLSAIGFAAGGGLAQPAMAKPFEHSSPFSTRGPAPAETRATHTRHSLQVQTLTPEAFAPFGRVLTAEGRPRLPVNTYGDRLDLYRESIETEQPIEWFIAVGAPRGLGVLFLERHMLLTQAFIPVGTKGFFTVVAAPDTEERDDLPALAALTVAHRQDPDPRLASLPLDLERRWYRHAGHDVTIAA